MWEILIKFNKMIIFCCCLYFIINIVSNGYMKKSFVCEMKIIIMLNYIVINIVMFIIENEKYKKHVDN